MFAKLIHGTGEAFIDPEVHMFALCEPLADDVEVAFPFERLTVQLARESFVAPSLVNKVPLRSPLGQAGHPSWISECFNLLVVVVVWFGLLGSSKSTEPDIAVKAYQCPGRKLYPGVKIRSLQRRHSILNKSFWRLIQLGHGVPRIQDSDLFGTTLLEAPALSFAHRVRVHRLGYDGLSNPLRLGTYQIIGVVETVDVSVDTDTSAMKPSPGLLALAAPPLPTDGADKFLDMLCRRSAGADQGKGAGGSKKTGSGDKKTKTQKKTKTKVICSAKTAPHRTNPSLQLFAVTVCAWCYQQHKS